MPAPCLQAIQHKQVEGYLKRAFKDRLQACPQPGHPFVCPVLLCFVQGCFLCAAMFLAVLAYLC